MTNSFCKSQEDFSTQSLIQFEDLESNFKLTLQSFENENNIAMKQNEEKFKIKSEAIEHVTFCHMR